MNFPFRYDIPARDKYFLGRTDDIDKIVNILSTCGSVIVYGEPGTGCKSLSLAALCKFRINNPDVIVAEVDFMRARTTEDILLAYADGVLKAFGSTAQDFKELSEDYLGGTHLVFDVECYSDNGQVLSFNWLPDRDDVDRVISLPSAIAAWRGVKVLLFFHHFQNILFPEDSDMLLSALEKVAENSQCCSMLFTGSQFNRLREIFDVRRFFWLTAVRLIPSTIEMSLIVDFVFKGFQTQGKVLEKNIIIGAVEVLRSNPMYINQLFSIVDAGARGYVNSQAVQDGLDILVQSNRKRFISCVNSLTDFQLSLLKAILDGEIRFSAASVIEKYHLNSSANVKRLKDALTKKEIVWFDEEDIPHVQDILFELWLRKEYFAQ